MLVRGEKLGRSRWDKQTKAFILGLLEVKNEARKLNLFETYHALDTATKVVGFEVENVLRGYMRKKK